MADERDVMDEAGLAAVARHALHDEELIAADASGGLESEGEAAQARALVERCTVCRDLHRDIAAIGAALGREATFAAHAPRDFRLTAEDARRIGGRVSSQGLFASFRRLVVGFARPVGASLATFGLVGLLLGSMTLGAGGAATALAPTGAPAASAGSAEGQPGGPQPEVPKATGGDTTFGSLATEDTGRTNVEPGPGAPSPGDAGLASWSPAAWLFAGSLTLLVLGVLLLLVSLLQGRRGAPRT